MREGRGRILQPMEAPHLQVQQRVVDFPFRSKAYVRNRTNYMTENIHTSYIHC